MAKNIWKIIRGEKDIRKTFRKFKIPSLEEGDNFQVFQVFILELFYFLSILLVVFVILELFWPRIILAYINLNYVLLIWLLNGIILLLVKKEDLKN